MPAAGAPRAPVLLIAYHYPPENTIGAARPARFAKYLARRGHAVQVVANQGDGATADGVARVPAPGARPGWASRALRLITRYALPYDDRLDWAPHAIRVGDPFCRQRPVILSTHPPVATHFAALALKRRHRLAWIADFRDPIMAGHPKRTGWRAAVLDRVMERLIFRHADLIIANTEAVGRLWADQYPRWRDKITVIWNGFDPEDGLAPLPPCGRARREIAHVGVIYGGRSPAPVIRALDRLIAAGTLVPDSIRLRLLGPVKNDALAPVADARTRLEAAGALAVEDRMAPRQEALTATLAADILLLLELNAADETAVQLPAKIFEYIRACRPILAITPPDSVTRTVLAQSGVPHLCLSPTEPPERFDAALATFLATPPGPIAPSPAFLATFDAARQTEALAEAIDRLARRQT